MPNNKIIPQPLVTIKGLHKSYQNNCVDCAVLHDVNLTVASGQFVVLLGVSGSGKSTLLNLISGIDDADQGTITIAGTNLMNLTETDRTLFRRDHIGIVFQFFNLIPTLTVQENISLPLELRGENRRSTAQRARDLLSRVGLLDRAHDFPDKLSGGEQQRIAIARALIHEPALVLADEPTGNLDESTGRHILGLLLELTREANKTLIMATHDPQIVPLADCVYRVQGSELTQPEHTPVADALPFPVGD